MDVGHDNAEACSDFFYIFHIYLDFFSYPVTAYTHSAEHKELFPPNTASVSLQYSVSVFWFVCPLEGAINTEDVNQ